ncbi:MAG TPA: CDP-alcohol phosphatidyltransferase family protein [Gemmatimonadaceae bacterium]|nr:CDP-alcohol phosphatidyltransferase family protein [Gemmatimonadaceae bacterium]
MPAPTRPAAPPATPRRFTLATRANAVALVRALLAFVVVALLYRGRHLYLGAVVLTGVAIWMDALDGWVARRFGEVSRFGAVLDILTDRIVELTYWITFAALGWIPVWVPLVVAVRGLLVDGARALAFERGYTAFGATTMMSSPLGRLLVSSRASRNAYGAAKVLAFTLLILASAAGIPEALRAPVALAAQASVFVAVALCVVRGVPVLAEARRLLDEGA